MRNAAPILVAALLTTAPLVVARAQSRPAPTADPTGTATGARPIPGPVYESPGFSRAVKRGTRTRTGAPGPKYWVQHPRYQIEASGRTVLPSCFASLPRCNSLDEASSLGAVLANRSRVTPIEACK